MITKDKVSELPKNPGVYKFFDISDILLYVGKAKNLKNRVSSYFNKSNQHNRKTRKLVSQINRIEFTIVNTEFDALLLENNLIKTHQPKYNILLKDDKTYPYILITEEPFPRLVVSRRLEGKYDSSFGPFTSIRAMNAVLELIQELYTIRTCRYHLSQENIKKRKFQVCLEYHIGNCKAPCVAKQSEEAYDEDIRQIKHILKGNISSVERYFKNEMLTHAENLAFEKAEEYKQKWQILEKFQSKSLVVNPSFKDIDVFAIVSGEEYAFVNYLKINNGSITYTKTVEIKKQLEESEEEILNLLAFNFRAERESTSKEIISNISIQLEENIINTLPKIGDKKKLLQLSLKNAMQAQKDRMNRSMENKQKQKNEKVLEELQKVLRLKNLPKQIECFDNSNIQGTNPVASMVCFIDGKPAKKEYRHFNIKTVEGPDDFASMFEIVHRRYRRQLEEERKLPDLIVIDGGKGQLNAACRALKNLDLYGSIPIIGIAKRLEEIYFPEDELPLHIYKKSPALKLIQRTRDEAHRFAIEFHRLKRSNSSIQSELSQIKGIGEATETKLLKHFKTVKKIKEVGLDEIAKIIGKAKAKVLMDGLQKKNTH